MEALVDHAVTVEEDEIAEAMALLLERAKLVVEGAGTMGDRPGHLARLLQ